MIFCVRPLDLSPGGPAGPDVSARGARSTFKPTRFDRSNFSTLF